jgi:acyl-CoA thioesterase I
MEVNFMDIIRQISIFGDSILKGVIFDKKSEHYCLTKEDGIKNIEDKLNINIKNNCKFGYTIEKGYKQLQRELKNGLSCDVVLLEYGGNDCDHNWAEVSSKPEEKHLPKTPINVFEQTYRKIIKELMDKGIRPIMMSLPPIDADKYFEWIIKSGLSRDNIIKWLGDVQTIYRFQELYSNIVTKIAFETNSLYVDIRSLFLDRHDFKSLICDDGIHPNDEGHKLINNAFLEFANGYIG